MSKQDKARDEALEREYTDSGEAGEQRSAGRKTLHILARAADVTVDMTSGAIVTFFKAVGTVLLILLVTGMMFACVFAYYVKTCLTPNLDLSLEDFKLN